MILILSTIQIFTGLNDLVGYTIAGFILSLSDHLFKKAENQNNRTRKS